MICQRQLPIRMTLVLGLGVYSLLCFSFLRLLLVVNSPIGAIEVSTNLVVSILFGILSDFVVVLALVTPVALMVALLPNRFFEALWGRIFLGVFVFFLICVSLFVALAELLFWREFGSRFNFIAVDYLIYTHEVIGTIHESFPMAFFLTVIFVIGLTLTSIAMSTLLRNTKTSMDLRGRAAFVGTLAITMAVSVSIFSPSYIGSLGNRYVDELAKNGLWSFVSAFKTNELRYEQYYATLPQKEAFARTRHIVSATGDEIDTLRVVKAASAKKKPNIVIVCVESLSADFLGIYGNQSGLTPHIDELARKSLFFRNCYATGTRTVRGIEAITLSIPPTPGRSIVKRPHNENLFSLGTLTSQLGYENMFIYSGYGYFDNMNSFFEGNGFRAIDRGMVPKEEITFGNIWGICDGDLYNKVLLECDKVNEKDKPFCTFVMTTSNHRPYTYPDVIDIPSGEGRHGAVKYTDHALGEFIDEAKKKKWFDNTLFVVVADHCAAAAGKVSLPVARYHIPLLFYGPSLVHARTVDEIASQIDIAPTIMHFLGVSYRSRFFGRDLLASSANQQAFVSTYQKLGMYRGNFLVSLGICREVNVFSVSNNYSNARAVAAPDLVDDTIAMYETAAIMFQNGRYSSIDGAIVSSNKALHGD